MKDIKQLEWIEIFLWYKCNYRCFFCFENKIREQDEQKLKSEIEEIILNWFNSWKKFIIFSWGEPTLYNELPNYIKYSKEIWYERILIHTNWTRTSDMLYLEELYYLWLNWIVFSFHWFWGISDIVTKNDNSFYNLNKSLINASKIKKIDNNFSIDTNTVLNKYNINSIEVLFKYFLKFPIQRRMFTLPYSMYFYTTSEKKMVFPNLWDLILNLKKILDYSSINNIQDVVIEAIPYCIFEKKYWKYIEKNYRSKKNVSIPSDSVANSITDEQHYTWWKIKFPECIKCIKNNECFWFSENFYEINNWINIVPILSP